MVSGVEFLMDALSTAPAAEQGLSVLQRQTAARSRPACDGVPPKITAAIRRGMSKERDQRGMKHRPGEPGQSSDTHAEALREHSG